MVCRDTNKAQNHITEGLACKHTHMQLGLSVSVCSLIFLLFHHATFNRLTRPLSVSLFILLLVSLPSNHRVLSRGFDTKVVVCERWSSSRSDELSCKLKVSHGAAAKLTSTNGLHDTLLPQFQGTNVWFVLYRNRSILTGLTKLFYKSFKSLILQRLNPNSFLLWS